MVLLILCAVGAVFPPDAGLLDVKKFGARGNGSHDDTAAIHAAIAAGQKQGLALYFPNGTYVISETLRGSAAAGDSAVVWEGQTREKAVIRLQDACPGFTDAQKARPMIEIARRAKAGYGHALRDLTLDAGKRNPGATGVQIACPGQACIRGVTIRAGDGKGKVGLDMTRGPEIGPVLVKDVRIIGFDFGVRAASAAHGMTFEDVVLEGQARAGLANEGQCLAIRGLTSRNNGPAVINAKGPGLLALVDCTLQGSREAGSLPAVENESALFARDVTSGTYREPIHNAANSRKPEGRRKVEEFVSQPVVGLISAPGRSPRLPVKPTPDVSWDGPETWTSPTRFGAVADDDNDDSAAVQAAIDSGRTTILFPPGRYAIKNTVVVRGAARRLIGHAATIDIGGLPPERAAFQVVAGASPTVVFERFAVLESPACLLENTSARALVAKDGLNFSGRMTGTGDVFLENLSTSRSSGWTFNRQNVWARGLSVENSAQSIAVNGGSLWVLGLTGRASGTLVASAAGGRTEVLGGLVQSTGSEPNVPLFAVTDGSLGLVVRDATAAAQSGHVLARETRAGQTKDLTRVDLSNQQMGGVVVLFVGPK